MIDFTPVLIVLAFVLALVYPVLMAWRSDWRANSPGRSLFAWSLIVAGVLAAPVARVLGWQQPVWMVDVIYGAIIIGLLIQNVTLIKAQNRRAHRLAAEREEAR